MKKKIAVISLLLALAMIFVSCNSDSTDENVTPQGQEAATQGSANKETTPDGEEGESKDDENKNENENGEEKDETPWSDGLEYGSYGDGTCAVLGMGTCADEDIIIPEKSPAGDKVIAIESCAFGYGYGIKSVELPEGLKRIETCAFAGCVDMRELKLPSTLEKIGEGAFCLCINLLSVDIPDSVTEIGLQAFMASSRLSTLRVGTGLTEIDKEVFAYCNIIELYDPNEVVSVKFLNNVKIQTSADFESKVRVEGDYLIYSDTQNDEYYLIGYLGNDTHLTLPESIDGHDYVIRKNAFENFVEYSDSGRNNLSNVVSVTIPKGVSEIEKNAFENCYSLTEIYNLSDVEIKSGYNEALSLNVNYAYTSLAEKSKLIKDGDFVFLKETVDQAEQYTLIKYVGTGGDVVLPESIEGHGYSIGSEAFNERIDIRSVKISDKVTSIGAYAFAYCKNLLSVDIGKGVKSIGNGAFYSDSSLISIVIPSNVEKIESGAFSYCRKLMEIYNLSSVNIVNTSEVLGDVVVDAKSIYKSLDQTSKLVEKDGYIFYDDRDGSGRYLLVEHSGADAHLTLPESINGQKYDIYKYAFESSYELLSVVIPDGVDSIGPRAFTECIRLRSVECKGEIKSVDASAFYECYCIKEVPKSSEADLPI